MNALHSRVFTYSTTGNAKFLLDYSNPVRSGILLHTGEWRMNSDWVASMDMPNSEGLLFLTLKLYLMLFRLYSCAPLRYRTNLAIFGWFGC